MLVELSFSLRIIKNLIYYNLITTVCSKSTKMKKGDFSAVTNYVR